MRVEGLYGVHVCPVKALLGIWRLSAFAFMHSGLGYQGCESCFHGVIKSLPFRLVGFKGSVLSNLVASDCKALNPRP